MLCNPNLCPPVIVIFNQRGDGICNPNCMNPYCNYDSGVIYDNSTLNSQSDCFQDCKLKSSLCSINTQLDGKCNVYCDNLACGYDFGSCGYCDKSCIKYLGEKYQLGNECNPECNTTSCYYDNGACLECSTGCNLTIWGDGVCNEECNNVECNYDNGDCFNITCAPDCYLWMIGNSICDETCYVEECNFDDTDCDCSPGCTLALLRNDICDEICNNYNCNLDDGKCGYCESGCFLDMLRNNICEEVCNTFRCKYDNYVCGCSLNCKAEDYGKCKPPCLVSDCKYDRVSSDSGRWCYDEDLIKFTALRQFHNDKNSNNIYSFESCSAASSYKCNLSMSLDSKSCYPECYFKECNFGLCNPYSDMIFIGMWRNNSLDSRSDLFLTNFSIAYTNKYIEEKIPDFKIYIVTSNQKAIYPSGNGTLISPFETLDYALQSLYLSGILTYEAHFLYLYNDGNYTLSDSIYLSGAESSLTIASYNKSQILIKINEWSGLSCLMTADIKFENFIFEGLLDYKSCNSSVYCEYCSYSYYNDSDGFYYNDRSQRIFENVPINSCTVNKSQRISLFYVQNLILINVEFRNFRSNYDSIIYSNGTIQFYNVTFDNIWLSGKESNAVINFVGDNADFTYIGGSVTRLNNGFEFGDPLDFRGFLYFVSYSTLLIKNVEFKYNLVYLKPKSSLSTSSLIFINSISRVEIDNCTFIYNYCEAGIFNSILNIETYDYSINETFYLTYLTKTHIYIHNSLFISNYGKLGLIHIEFLGLLLNVHLQNLTIESNGAEIDSLIYIHNFAILEYYKEKTIQKIILKNSNSFNVISVPRWCKLCDISFKNNHAIGMVNAANLVNFDLKLLKIISNGYPYENANINSLILDYFIENNDLYISKKASNVKSLDCDFMLSISNSVNLNFEDIIISKNVCRNSSPTSIIYNSNSYTLTSISCSKNIGNSQMPICFYFNGLYDTNFTDSEFFGNINNYVSGYGALKIESENTLYITNCSFINSTASFSPAVYFSGSNVYIEVSIFELNEAKQGNGGALYLIFMPQDNKVSLFMISSSDFNWNSANANGGAIFLLQKSSSSSNVNFLISQSNLTGNYAENGAAIYIDNSIILSKDSYILSSNFSENFSKQSGTVVLYFSSGILSFISCKFLENYSSLAAVLAVDIGENKQNLSSKIIIELSVFRNNTGNSVIYADNQNTNSTIETKNCSFEYNNARVASLNFDYFSDIGSIFQANLASYGSCFYLQNSAILYASSQFLNNTSEEHGGAIALSSKSVFHCDNCSFIQNKAKIKGGVINSEQDSLFIITNSKFEKNSCGGDGSAISAFNCNLMPSSLFLSNFSDNHASKLGVISLISSKIAISSSTFSHNLADGYSSGLLLTFSDAEIYDSKFENQNSI